MFYTDDRQGRPAKQDSASVCTCVCVFVGREKRVEDGEGRGGVTEGEIEGGGK